MKACIVLQKQYAKVGHAIARILKEHHDVDRFSAYIFSPSVLDAVRSQTDILYDPILADHELHAEYKQEPIDWEWLDEFEHTYRPPNLWQYLYADRKLMMSMGPKEETTTAIDPLYDHEDLIRIFQVRARAIEEMLKKDRPDFILFFTIGALGHMILYHVAKKLGIRVYTIDFPRIQNRLSISSDYRTLSVTQDAFRVLRQTTEQTSWHAEATALLHGFREHGSLDLAYMDIVVGILPKKMNSIHPASIMRTIRYLGDLSKNPRTVCGCITENRSGV